MTQNISYIIPCYNCADTIDESICSILSGNFEEGDEIILIDDASTDNTLAVLSGYAAQHDFVKLLRHHINKGTAAAGRNTGIDQSKNELIFCLDSDNVLQPGSVIKLKSFLLENELDVAAFGQIEYFSDDTKSISSVWKMTPKLSFIEALNDPMKTPCGSGNFMYTKAIWKKVGRYNEFLGGAYDSELFGLKLLAEGAKFWTLEGVGYFHRNGYESTYVREYNKRNMSLLFLAGLMDYLNQVHEDDVEYIFGKGRYRWMEEIEQHPLRPKSKARKSLRKRIINRLRRMFL